MKDFTLKLIVITLFIVIGSRFVAFNRYEFHLGRDQTTHRCDRVTGKVEYWSNTSYAHGWNEGG